VYLAMPFDFGSTLPLIAQNFPKPNMTFTSLGLKDKGALAVDAIAVDQG